VLPEEKGRAQPFEVDLDLSVDLALASASDRLADTVDYAGIAETVAAVVSGPPPTSCSRPWPGPSPGRPGPD
jgi:dihydroneopterin aldolase